MALILIYLLGILLFSLLFVTATILFLRLPFIRMIEEFNKVGRIRPRVGESSHRH